MFTPVRFGKYFLTERVAVGGMAEIFRAKLLEGDTKQPIVVKQILPQYARNAEFIKMFVDEAKIAVSLNHRNIVAVYELGRVAQVYYMAMEFVQGRNLAEILEEGAQRRMLIPVTDAVFIAAEICKGLDYAHRKPDASGESLGVVHRDVSPPNIMISFGGEVKLTDFGIAKARHKLAMTQVGVIKGTYGYMSPEQVAGQPVGRHTDIFSCGILLHEMLTGQRLFADSSDLAALERVRSAQAAPPSTVNPRVPKELDTIVLKALALSSADRYQYANEFQMDLLGYLAQAQNGGNKASLIRHMRYLFPTAATRHQNASSPAIPSLPHPTGLEQLKRASANATLSYAARDAFSDNTATQGDESTEGLVAMMNAAASGEFDDERTRLYARAGGRASSSGDAAAGKTKVPPQPSPPRHAAAPPAPPGSFFPSVAHVDGQADDTTPTEAEQDKAAASVTEPIAQADSPVAASGAPSANVARPTAEAEKIQPASQDRAPNRISQPAAPGSPRIHRDSGLIQMFTREPSGEQPGYRDPTGQHMSLAGGRLTITSQHKQVITGEVTSTNTGKRRRRPGSSMLSGTMRLFVTGLDGEPAPGSSVELPTVSAAPSSSRVKPTVLGWAVIFGLLAAAISFVIYKKARPADEVDPFKDAATLTPTSIGSASDSRSKAGAQSTTKDRADKAKPRLVNIELEPKQALLFLHQGDAPQTVSIAKGAPRLVRLEREGYAPGHHLVGETTNGSGQPIRIELSPVGADGRLTLPESEATEAIATEPTKVSLDTDPPAASVWLYLGRGSAQLTAKTSTRYYLKALAEGHEPAYLTITASELQAASADMKRTIRLEPNSPAKAEAPEPSVDSVDSASAGETAKQAPPPAVKPDVTEPKVSRPRRARRASSARRAATRQRRRRADRKRKSTRKRTPTAKQSKNSKMALPSWAQ